MCLFCECPPKGPTVGDYVTAASAYVFAAILAGALVFVLASTAVAHAS